MTLESQYKEFLKLNPRADLSFEEWTKVNSRIIKQALINMMKADEDLGLYDEPKQNWYHDGKIIDGKQKTLEEVAERKFQNIGDRLIFEDGAKWQQERMYSEEDLKSAFLDGWELRDGDLPFPKAKNKWFNTVKKKS